LVLRIGGPKLLRAFNETNHLPSSSFIYKMLQNSVNIDISVHSTVDQRIENNLNSFFKQRYGFYSIKIDEVHIVPSIVHDPRTNEFTGICETHKDNVPIKFDNLMDLEELADALEKNEVHYAKEALFVSISQLGKKDATPKPILIVPICTHSTGSFQEKAYKSIVKNFKSNNPNASLLNIATDGDPYRSKILNQLKRKNYSIDEIQDLKHFDLNLVFDEFSVNKDPKHVCKRLRCFIISVNSKKDMKLIKTPISRKYDCN